jgi:hypothetical protein
MTMAFVLEHEGNMLLLMLMRVVVARIFRFDLDSSRGLTFRQMTSP